MRLSAEPHKKSISCKNLGSYSIRSDINNTHRPAAGDVAIFRVKKLGKHTALQGATGHRQNIFPGDTVEAAFGNRYATSQFEGYIPSAPLSEYHILSIGGAVGLVASMHCDLEDVGPTVVELIGYAVDSSGRVINCKFLGVHRKKFTPATHSRFTTVLSLGSSMDSGKTTSAAYLCRGLRHAGLRPAYMKLTGTVCTKDLMFASDCGAIAGVDFSYAGFPSTYLCDLSEIKDLYATLIENLQTRNPDVVVVEIADGLLERETKMLLEDSQFMATVDHTIFSGEDPLGVLRGEELLTRLGKRPIALSGLFTASPLMMKEVESHTSTPVMDLEKLEHIGEHPLMLLFSQGKKFLAQPYRSPRVHDKVELNQQLSPQGESAR